MAKPSNPDLARRILDLALEELGSKSPDKVNMRAFAERAGVSPTAIYYYFASKDDLFERIKFDIMDELGARIAVATARGGSARDRLEALIRAYVAWCLDRPHLARLLMEDLPPKEELTEETTRKYYAVFFAARDLIEEAVERGRPLAPKRRAGRLDGSGRPLGHRDAIQVQARASPLLGFDRPAHRALYRALFRRRRRFEMKSSKVCFKAAIALAAISLVVVAFTCCAGQHAPAETASSKADTSRSISFRAPSISSLLGG